ncbi:ABC transporter ATP-binding protein [Solemya velum gill symbiont]|uniref:ABC transporter ATP-binding protein n=2 Tax=Solemya velum gill symbiont TaxID=2340 RepID=A0A1T2JAT0_SOVGS|nr:ABC transporter ATP-binding protein [Solemya velum gill symbiont]OOY33903.1 ABC transporter ATP-binding protein [Solemya velum gill symbiont]OOY36557.1 ABC transporter ATP-binding protein [Solemya velum gill symbiont]OOY45493.1 ABC transporter ATP-binding protein [Solemya velum gill symbiont]OOY49691.1 ABC transporter ATP-binding protein [Solemya velum gill symbiont]OOY49839.1 ABC transporter ATP-binding protein [Solemya velum gill symbiont]
MTNPTRDIPHYLKLFQYYLGWRVYLVFALALAAAMAEGFGILMLLPLLHSLDGGLVAPDGSVTDVPTKVGGYLQQFLEMLGLEHSSIAILMIITLAFIIKGALLFGSSAYSAYLNGQLLRELKGRLFRHYSRMSYSYYTRRNTGHFINVINVQINQMLHVFMALVQLGVQLVNTLIYITLAFIVAWRFGAMALVIGIILVLLFRFLNSYVRELSRDTAAEHGQLSKLLIQSLHAFKYLTATGQMDHLQNGIKKSIHRLTGYEVRSGIAGAFTGAVREPITVVFIMVIVLIQMVVLEQPLSPIMISILLFHRGLNAVMAVQSTLQSTLGSVGGLEMVRDEFKAVCNEQETNGNQHIPPLGKAITLKNVDFGYDSQMGNVLHDISLEIPARTSVAFVGESGAGKSTLVDLITLMLKPQGGQVLIDGVPGKDVELASWRKQIGYVSQETVIFDDTIANNICMWVGDVEKDQELDQRVREAARQAHIDHFIETLPDGYQTLVGDRGLRLSGGQRQRLFIARELFRKPNLLILDEATSSLDTESEQAIQQSIDELKGQITVVIIAHRLSTIRKVDHIYVFEHGRLIEQGAYEELRDSDESRFGKLIAMQVL